MFAVGIIIALLVFAGAIFGVVYLIRSTSKAQSESLHETLGGISGMHRDAVINDAGAVVFTHGNYAFRASMSTGKHAHFTLTMTSGGGRYPEEFAPADDEGLQRVHTVKNQPLITLTPETRFQRFGKLLRINREVQTGDHDFDRKVYISSNAPDDLIVDAFRRAEVRRAIVAFFEAGYTRLVMFGAAAPLLVSAAKPPAQAAEKDHHAEHLKMLGVIAQGMPAIRVEKPGVVGMSRPTTLALLIGLWSFMSFIALIVLDDMWVTLVDDPVSFGLLGSVVAWVLAWPLLIVVMRGRSDAFGSLVAAILCLMVSLPCTGVLGLRAVNALLDFSPEIVTSARIVDKRISKGKNTTHYYVTIDPGEQYGPNQELGVDSDLYYDLPYGEEAEVVLGEGFLGWVWVDDLRPAR